jgi:hypothetical protein
VPKRNDLGRLGSNRPRGLRWVGHAAIIHKMRATARWRCGGTCGL